MKVTDEQPLICPKCDHPFYGPNAGRALGGHAKTHNRTLAYDYATMLPVPECFDEDAWRFAVEQLRTEHLSMRPSRFTRSFALAESCAICPLSFMEAMEGVGRCNPPAGAATPRVRAARGVDDMADEA